MAGNLLPTPYFQGVFTIPKELSSLTLGNRKALYNLLFRSAAASLNERLAQEPAHCAEGISSGALLRRLAPEQTRSLPGPLPGLVSCVVVLLRRAWDKRQGICGRSLGSVAVAAGDLSILWWSAADDMDEAETA